MSNAIVIPPSPQINYVSTDIKTEIDSLVAYIEPVQAGTGDPSPDNIRPITGFSSVNVFRTGKNLLGGDAFADAAVVAVNNATYCAKNEETKTVFLTANQAISQKVFSQPLKFKENTRYTIIVKGKKSNTNNSAMIDVHYTDGSRADIRFNDGRAITADTLYTQAYVTAANKTVKELATYYASGTATLYYDECGVFEGVLTAAGFEEYKGAKYSSSLSEAAGTVFGGSFDFVSGELIVDRSEITSYNGETLPSTWISDRDVYSQGATPTIGAQVVYALETPIKYYLSEATAQLLLGENVFFANSGDVGLALWVGGAKKIKLNNVNMTDYFTPTGISVTYKKVQGENGGTYLSGEREEDVLAWKAVVKLTCMPLTEEQQSEVLQKVTSSDPTLYYFDPLLKGYRTIHYMASVSEAVYKGHGGTGLIFWTGLVITAEEK